MSQPSRSNSGNLSHTGASMAFQDNGIAEGLLHGMEQKGLEDGILVDKFFTDMYQYYVAKGIGAVVLSEFCAVLTLAFTVCFSAFLLAFVDWNGLLQCHDEDTCQDVNSSLVANPFHNTPTMFTFFVFTYFVIFAGIWLYKCGCAMTNVADALEMANFYKDKLGIQVVELQHMEWYEVVERLTLLHDHGSYRVTSKKTLTAHDVALRLMRKENYMIGLINKKTLDLVVPWWLTPFASDRLFLTQSLEWSLSFCLMDYMFNEHCEIAGDFLHDVSGLQWRFQVVGLINFLMLPFLLIYMTFHFFLQNAQQFHSSKAYLGPRQWSPLALWEFREFNELSHVFEERINKSIPPATEYIQTFQNPYLTILARCVTYIAGAFIATLLLVSVLSDGALLYVHVADYNLLWYLGLFSACYAGARSLIPDETKVQESPTVLLKRTCAHTHYFPEQWEHRANSVEVKNQVCELFQFKAQIFLMEVLSVVLTPAVLCFSLPACAPAVVAFVR
jgi:autophagy-related protein 9